MEQEPPQFLVVTFPAQGHLNPAYQFCKNLIRVGGARVTLLTCVSAVRRLTKLSFPDGFSLATFSDGYDDGFKFAPGVDTSHYASEFRRRGSETLTELIVSRRRSGGRPFSAVVYTLLLPWAAGVARSLATPSALLWVQPATVFALYYLYFNGYGDKFDSCFGDPSSLLELPGLPPMRSRDLPSFLLPLNSYLFIRTSFREQMDALAEESNPTILINTFAELEPDALSLKALEDDKVKLIPIGPLLPSGYLDEEVPEKSSDTSFGVDLFHGSKGYKQWLDSQPEASVVYVSFGTIAVLSEEQMEQIARGLIDSGRTFLWVVRTDQLDQARSRHYMEELEHQGMVVPWCSQLEVLSHPSLGCFVTHCGWNSTLESLVMGAPVVAFPQWTDQGTNAKLIEDVWKTGVRVVRDEEEGVVEAAEIRRCIDLVMGGSGGTDGQGSRSNARKWRDLARQAAREGGSSHANLKDFVYKAILRF